MQDIFPWQLPIWQQVVRSWQNHRLPHALLCCGVPGLGKGSFAHQLAYTLLCENPNTEGRACQRCRSCHLLKMGNHPDFLQVKPIELGKKIQVDQIRGAIQFCALTAHYARYRVLLINPAEAMNTNAANSVLKLLEEPPPKTCILLVSHQPQALLATVRSRCQRLDFNQSDVTLMRAWLQTQLPATQNGDLLLRLANQAPLAALATAQIMEARVQLFESVTHLLTQNAEPIATATLWQKHEVKQTLQWMLSWTMDLIRIKMTGQTHYLVNSDWQVTLESISQQFTLSELFKLLDIQNETYQLVQRTNSIKPQSLLESIALSWLECNEKR